MVAFKLARIHIRGFALFFFLRLLNRPDSCWPCRDTAYRVTVSNAAGQLAAAAFQTALPAESAMWPGAEWISGGTQLRGAFRSPAGKRLARATAYASGIGVFAMTLNGGPRHGRSSHFDGA